jgi:hypothetical protein
MHLSNWSFKTKYASAGLCVFSLIPKLAAVRLEERFDWLLPTPFEESLELFRRQNRFHSVVSVPKFIVRPCFVYERLASLARRDYCRSAFRFRDDVVSPCSGAEFAELALVVSLCH